MGQFIFPSFQCALLQVGKCISVVWNVHLNSPSTQKDIQNLALKPAQSKVILYHLWNALLQHITESSVFELKWVESEFVSTTQASVIVLG